jgi:hypothetical protein
MKPVITAHVPGPRLACPAQAADFQMEIVENRQSIETMSTDVQNLIKSFNQLSEAEQREVASEILRRTINFDLPDVSDEELVRNAEGLLLELDRREAEDG